MARERKVDPPPQDPSTETLDAARTTPMLPDRIGRYHIKRVIASGGMGTVYEAAQDNPRRVVAVKVMKQGIASKSALRRFEYEGQILGRLRHPGIAQIYEAGTHHDPAAPGAAVPYFAMEYIPNAKLITAYADEKKLGTRQRMELFAKVCDAIHHGHQKGIIHRDLKPSNILVTSDSATPPLAKGGTGGVVKIIDFGVARCTDSDLAVTTLQTDVGQLIGTLQYMSPEQCEGDPHDIDTRSDVYALGVVFYQLLCGKLPYDVTRMAMHQATRAIRELHPTKLSTLDKTLRGDVETIALKALEKERERRYQSAADLGHDIHRYLSGEAILARRASIVYQLRLFARRNKAVFASLAVVFVVLVAGIIVSTSFYVRAQGEAERAKKERDKAERIASFMGDILKGAGPSVALGRDATMLREMLDEAANRIRKGELKDSPEAELQLRLTVGETYEKLGAYDQDRELLEPSVELARRIHGQEHPDVATRLNLLGQLLAFYQGDPTGGELLCLQALDMRRKLLGQEHIDVAQSLSTVGIIKFDLGKLPEAERLLREALRIQRKLLGEHRDTWLTLGRLGNVLSDKGSYREAEEMYLSALPMARKLFGPVRGEIAWSLVDVAEATARKGDFPQAEQLLREALTMNRTLHGDNHFMVADDLLILGGVRSQQGFYRDAEGLLRESITLFGRLQSYKNIDARKWLPSLGEVLWHQGKDEEAEQVLREARQIQLAFPAEKNIELAGINEELAYVLMDTRRHEEAELLVNEALALKSDALGDDHLEVAGLLCTLGSIRERKGDRSSAEQLVRQAVEMSRRLDDVGMETGAHLHQLGALLYRQDKLSEAEAVLRESLQMQRSVLGGDHPAVAECSIALAKLAARQGRFSEGEELARDALRIYEARPDGPAWLRADTQSALGATLTGQGRFTEAETLLVEGFDVLRDQSIAPPWIKGDALLALTVLYEQWDAAEPGKGHAEKAAEWRARLETGNKKLETREETSESQNAESPK